MVIQNAMIFPKLAEGWKATQPSTMANSLSSLLAQGPLVLENWIPEFEAEKKFRMSLYGQSSSLLEGGF